ncbi:hypothetical protein A3H85_03340 [Candidatus Daviesbacteria bacterium RIFCSPLOWO2_02_FULL_40_8]|uniref:Uncharacterized protein n=1 Tax=Candidatus Daviesbacteria bacterium RIFCSPLOWO2_01_FULL_40_24 TaxID=1797787 RepID=A0A1F5MIT7_9BACT|nr:MAG: hypothetical protein A2780_03110 [Candidatus Daviesbacteria bacterium RIFCSPHIGHO2_01_FULL_41_45]OGE34979.1 MAG: hypothetical protein A3C32_02570 [Candidatus Daviesbacteria bacterium RIFCSPHIGHO2_02_FULL_41_14]OGE65273.1 MAG: hypothetical protein A3B49_02485 [Candidatus Daviesbacteria bacterium RIFCSPLOWO2_01_FULL_40_24]OGE66544.1 MAG: hypothetical protein A3H85_03340 [Candidatus Daviesbacteria bacterium RIFCSPLOWO2_02_FULL_40_8]
MNKVSLPEGGDGSPPFWRFDLTDGFLKSCFASRPKGLPAGRQVATVTIQIPLTLQQPQRKLEMLGTGIKKFEALLKKGFPTTILELIIFNSRSGLA